MIPLRTDTEEPSYASERRQMVEGLAWEVSDRRVLSAMRRIPRHLFVPEELRAHAYENRALPIGFGQTISQPLMVALMLQAAKLSGRERVLDVGAGSGYQAALLGELAEEVYAIELLPQLAERAKGSLREAGATNVTMLQGDGSLGYPEQAPYDVILVAAAAERIPLPLVEQLAEEGRLLIPVGNRYQTQPLIRVTKRAGVASMQQLGGCAFVPLVMRDQTGV